MQIVYKTVWIALIGLPALTAGDERAPFFVVFFALVALGFALAVPWRQLFRAPLPERTQSA